MNIPREQDFAKFGQKLTALFIFACKLTKREAPRYNATVCVSDGSGNGSSKSDEQTGGAKVLRVGLMGGTFDPVHHGHLFIAEEARVRCGLEKVIFFPNHTPAHRQGKTASADAETRFAMMRQAIAGNDYFEASRIEIDRPGRSYAIETLDAFQKQMPDAHLFYIVGADSIGEVLTWYQGEKLFEKCHFVAFSRPDYYLQSARAQLNEAQQARVIWMETVALDIASRDLRKRVQEGLPIRYLVPDVVAEEIHARGLYR